MTKQQIFDYVAQQYGISPDYPWARYPNDAVLRHNAQHRRWFALIMDVPAHKFGLSTEGNLEIINLKGEPAVIDGLRQSNGIYPAYHMNKTHWFSLDLQANFSPEEVYRLIDWSFDLTR